MGRNVLRPQVTYSLQIFLPAERGDSAGRCRTVSPAPAALTGLGRVVAATGVLLPMPQPPHPHQLQGGA